MSAFGERVREELDRLGVGSGPLVVAVSGGVDSVVLARTVAGLGVKIVVAHVDHGLRPDSSEDAAFVERLARDLGMPLELLAVEVEPGNVQAQAREARYRALGALAERVGSPFVAVAHTATDQAETVLLHLVRGAGMRGLGGMPKSRRFGDVTLVRPLLWASRTEVEAEAQAHSWEWREDPSNASDRFLRNRLRHHVLPLLEEEGGPGTVQRIAHAAHVVRQSLGAPGAAWLFETYATSDPQGGTIRLDLALDAVGEARLGLWGEALGAWAPDAPRTEAVLFQIDRLVDRPVGARVALAGVDVWREAGAVRFEREGEDFAGLSVPLLQLTTILPTPHGTLTIYEDDPPQTDSEPTDEAVDAHALGAAVTLRRWRDGDSLRPLGLDGTKRVSDLLRERGVSPSQRARQLVLCGEDGRIVWVVGHRWAEHAAIRADTERVVRLRWSPSEIAPSGGAG